MRQTGHQMWMPDSHNGGDILLKVDKDLVQITIERGMRDRMGCTKAAVFKLHKNDVQEFIMGLSALVLPPTANRTEE